MGCINLILSHVAFDGTFLFSALKYVSCIRVREPGMYMTCDVTIGIYSRSHRYAIRFQHDDIDFMISAWCFQTNKELPKSGVLHMRTNNHVIFHLYYYEWSLFSLFEEWKIECSIVNDFRKAYPYIVQEFGRSIHIFKYENNNHLLAINNLIQTPTLTIMPGTLFHAPHWRQ